MLAYPTGMSNKPMVEELFDLNEELLQRAKREGSLPYSGASSIWAV